MNYKGLKVLLFLTVAFFMAKNTYGQTSISGIINNYTSVTAVNTTCNSLTVSGTTGFNVGGKVLLIQMKGATVSGTQNANFGNITSYGNAGNYEFNEIYAIQGAIIYLKYTILKTYDPAALQLVTIPQYGDLTIAGTLTATPWDGNIGGVLVFESSGTVTFNADINIEGLGFKGGDRSPANSLNSCSYGFGIWYAAFNTNGYGVKGESISAYITGKEAARGNQASGGGGGHSSNTGAGGGANYGKGGIGGDQSNKPTGGGCNFFGVGFQGMGGGALASNYSNTLNKIFLGGGGGGGQQNNYIPPGPPTNPGGTAGNPGGGIVIIRAATIVGNGYTIYAGGYNNNSLNASVSTLAGYNSATGGKMAWGDSGGGGGAGGAVLLSATGYTSSLNVDVRGGRGDSVYTDVEINLGPGGGGGGGVVWVNGATTDPNIQAKITGGVTGLSWNFAFPVTVCSCSFGSAAGDPGAVLNNLVIPENTSVFNACVSSPVNLLSYTGKKADGKVYLNWSTAIEINNDHFVVEKSNDGKTFDYLTSVPGHGNSIITQNYFCTDASPLLGLNYYNLKQYDYNGIENTLGYVEVNLEGAEVLIEKIYPNPFSNELIIQTSEMLDKSKTTIRVINLLGAEMTSVTYQIEGQNIKLNANTLNSGIYYLQLVYEDNTEIRKISKE